MKYQLLFWSLVAIIVGIETLNQERSQAEPASIFQPIIRDIKTLLPENVEMRLPAFLPTLPEEITLYSFVLQDKEKLNQKKSLMVLISDTPDCKNQKDPFSCAVGGMAVANAPWKPDKFLQDAEDVTPIVLGNNLEGFYFVHQDSRCVIWQQNQLIYQIITPQESSEYVSKQQLIEIAKSAANEPAITKSDWADYQY
ncbi:MAG: hypothetical protein Tsb0014_32030 [Pleurocapsa sp.]